MDVFESALRTWRDHRDMAFAKYGLDITEIYAKGDFESLPPECLMAVCYVDAYACVQANIDDYTKRLGERIQALEESHNASKNICGVCYEDGIIDGMNRVLRYLEGKGE